MSFDFDNIELNYEDVINMIQDVDIDIENIDGDELYDKIDNLVGPIDEIAENNIIKLYRTIHLNSIEDLKSGNNIGESWSWNKNSAINFGYENLHMPIFLIYGQTNKQNINWEMSVFRCIMNDWDNSGSEENELVVKNGKKVKILDIKRIK